MRRLATSPGGLALRREKLGSPLNLVYLRISFGTRGLPLELMLGCGEVVKMFSHQLVLLIVSDTASLEIFFDLPIDDVFHCVVDGDGNCDRSSMLKLGSPEARSIRH